MSINTEHLQILLPRPHSAKSLDSESGIYHHSKEDSSFDSLAWSFKFTNGLQVSRKRVFAVLIGIDKPQFGLTGSVNDVYLFQDTITRIFGVENCLIQILVDEEASVEAMRIAIEQILIAGDARDTDAKILYFSGQSSFGMLHGYEYDCAKRNGLSAEEIEGLLKTSAEENGNNITVILDTSYSASFSPSDQTLLSPPYTLLAACGRNEIVRETFDATKKKYHGRFTLHLSKLLSRYNNLSYADLVDAFRDTFQHPECHGYTKRKTFCLDELPGTRLWLRPDNTVWMAGLSLIPPRTQIEVIDSNEQHIGCLYVKNGTLVQNDHFDIPDGARGLILGGRAYSELASSIPLLTECHLELGNNDDQLMWVLKVVNKSGFTVAFEIRLFGDEGNVNSMPVETLSSMQDNFEASAKVVHMGSNPQQAHAIELLSWTCCNCGQSTYREECYRFEIPRPSGNWQHWESKRGKWQRVREKGLRVLNHNLNFLRKCHRAVALFINDH